jgi:hypothetical protein
MSESATRSTWPTLLYWEIGPTAETLRLYSQIVGKVRLAWTPWINHAWQVTLFVSARGLATPLIPAGATGLTMEFDFLNHELVVRTTDGGERRVALAGCSVADFHAHTLAALAELGAATHIDPWPSEMPDPTPFPDDHVERVYDPDAAQRLWLALVQIDRVFHRFRSRFLGKCSPVHFFWGSFDLAVTRFSGRRAPLHPGGMPHLPDTVAQEAYSHEVSSAGFWPGGPGFEAPTFYAYAWPAPEGFAAAPVAPAAAWFDEGLGEFVLPYEEVRTAPDPDAALLAFLETTYAAAANLGGWDRAALECEEGQPGRPRPVG